MVWRELDLTWLQITLLGKLGLAWDIRVPTDAQIADKALPLEDAA
jgi:fatty-acid desaturase